MLSGPFHCPCPAPLPRKKGRYGRRQRGDGDDDNEEHEEAEDEDDHRHAHYRHPPHHRAHTRRHRQAESGDIVDPTQRPAHGSSSSSSSSAAQAPPPFADICPYIQPLPLCDSQRDHNVLSVLAQQGKYAVLRKIGYGTYSNVFLASRICEPTRMRDMAGGVGGSCAPAATPSSSAHEDGGNGSGPRATAAAAAPPPCGGTLYAIKSVEDSVISRGEILAGMLLRHPNISAMVEWFAIGNYYFLVYEFINGADLQVFWSDPRVTARTPMFTEARFAPLFVQVLDALLHCHALGIAHRDIKLENIVTDRTRAVLVDWGFCFFSLPPPPGLRPDRLLRRIAGASSFLCDGDGNGSGTRSRTGGSRRHHHHDTHRRARPHHTQRRPHPTPPQERQGVYQVIALDTADHLDADNVFVGTKDYLAPELLLDAVQHAQDLFPTDVYSLGVVLYCALMGRFPRGRRFNDALAAAKKRWLTTRRGPPRGLLRDPEFCAQMQRWADTLDFTCPWRDVNCEWDSADARVEHRKQRCTPSDNDGNEDDKHHGGRGGRVANGGEAGDDEDQDEIGHAIPAIQRRRDRRHSTIARPNAQDNNGGGADAGANDRTRGAMGAGAVRGKRSRPSKAVCDLLAKMLHPLPHCRPTLAEVRRHPWITRVMDA